MHVEPLWDFEILDHELSVLWAPLVVNVLDSMLHVVWKHLTTCSFKNSKISSKSFPFFYIKDIGTDNLGLFGWSYFLNCLFFANLDFNFSSILLNNTNMNWCLSFTDSKLWISTFQADIAPMTVYKNHVQGHCGDSDVGDIVMLEPDINGKI